MVLFKDHAALERFAWRMDFAIVSLFSIFFWQIVWVNMDSNFRIYCTIKSFYVACTLNNGQSGDGQSRGTCDKGKVCTPNGICVSKSL